MLEYAKHINARLEVVNWCSTVLPAREKKRGSLNQTEVEHIIDFLASPAAPERLRKMSYDQAKAGADKWSSANQKKGRHLVDGTGDIQTVHDFLDGTKIVKLLTKKAYQREGFFMAHCVGTYEPSKSVIYSYRDTENIPHATFEVSHLGGSIQQIKGKGNGPIHPRYILPILAFLQTLGVAVRSSEMANLGYHHVPQDVKAILDQFVDMNGKKAELLTLFGEEYLYGGMG